MEKKQKPKQEFEKILSRLTGQVGVDKKFLIDSIRKLRKMKTNQSPQIAILGTALYSILIENGLNESDTINPQRLIDRVNSCIYEQKYNMALEILEVLDSLEPCNRFDDKGKRLYNFSNPIEVTIMLAKYKFKNAEDLKYLTTSRSFYLLMKASIYENKGDVKQLEEVINEILEINPVQFEANLLKANVFYKKGSERQRKALLEAYEIAYSPNQVIAFLQAMSKFYFDKKEYQISCSCLLAITLYDDYSLVENNLKYIEKEANKMSITKFMVPTSDEVKRILKRNEIPRMVKEDNILMVEACYYACLKEEHPNENLLDLCRDIITQTFPDDNEILKLIEKKAKGDKKK